jgi:hypothetical protein
VPCTPRVPSSAVFERRPVVRAERSGMGRHPKTFMEADSGPVALWARARHQPYRASTRAEGPECGSQDNFRACLVSGDEPPFLPGTRPLETHLSLFHIYFSDRLPRARIGLKDETQLRADGGQKTGYRRLSKSPFFDSYSLSVRMPFLCRSASFSISKKISSG